MNLTTAQKALLATHIQANTNTLVVGSDPATAISVLAASHDPTRQAAVAGWYNQPAKGNDQQSFPVRNVWNPVTTLQQLNSAIKWQVAYAGSTAADRTESILLYQTMIWGIGTVGVPGLDMGDPQVRQGILRVFGDVAGGSAAAINNASCARPVGKNIELVCSDTEIGATTAFGNAHPVQVDAAGKTIYGQLLTVADIETVLFPNG